MAKLEKKHPLAIRWFHWINFPILFIMIWSGLRIYWAEPVYRVGLGDWTAFQFSRSVLYDRLDLSRNLAEGMGFHFLFAWIFTINGILYVLFLAFSGEWRKLVPNRKSFREAWQVVQHDLHLTKTAPPQGKFNAAQRLTYTGVIVMGFAAFVTGMAIYKPVQFSWLVSLCGGYQAARFEHFWIMILFFLFFLVHVAQVVRAGWNNFRAMVTGHEVVKP